MCVCVVCVCILCILCVLVCVCVYCVCGCIVCMGVCVYVYGCVCMDVCMDTLCIWVYMCVYCVCMHIVYIVCIGVCMCIVCVVYVCMYICGQGLVLSPRNLLTHLILTSIDDRGSYLPFLHFKDRNGRHREVKSLASSHTVKAAALLWFGDLRRGRGARLPQAPGDSARLFGCLKTYHLGQGCPLPMTGPPGIR